MTYRTSGTLNTFSGRGSTPLKRSTRLSGSRISVGGQKSGTSSAEFTIRPFRRLLCSPSLHGTPPSVPCVCTSPSLSIRHSSPLLLYNYRTLLAQEEMSYLTGQYGTVTWLEDIPLNRKLHQQRSACILYPQENYIQLYIALRMLR